MTTPAPIEAAIEAGLRGALDASMIKSYMTPEERHLFVAAIRAAAPILEKHYIAHGRELERKRIADAIWYEMENGEEPSRADQEYYNPYGLGLGRAHELARGGDDE